MSCFVSLFLSCIPADWEDSSCEIHVIPSIEFRWLLLSWRCQTARLSKGQGSSSVASCRKTTWLHQTKNRDLSTNVCYFLPMYYNVFYRIFVDEIFLCTHPDKQRHKMHMVCWHRLSKWFMIYCLPVAFVVLMILNDTRRLMFFGLCKCVVFMDDCKSSDVIIDHHSCFRFLLFACEGITSLPARFDLICFSFELRVSHVSPGGVTCVTVFFSGLSTWIDVCCGWMSMRPRFQAGSQV